MTRLLGMFVGEEGALSAAQTVSGTRAFANHWLKGWALTTEAHTVDEQPKFVVVILSAVTSLSLTSLANILTQLSFHLWSSRPC